MHWVAVSVAITLLWLGVLALEPPRWVAVATSPLLALGGFAVCVALDGRAERRKP